MAGREMKQNERGQENRWRDDQRKHVGHFTTVQDCPIYLPPLPSTWPRGKLLVGSKTAPPLSG